MAMSVLARPLCQWSRSAPRIVAGPAPAAWADKGPLAVLAALLLALVAATVAIAQSEPKFPALTGRIIDEAALIKAEDRAAIEADLKALEAKSTDQIVVYTTRSLQGYAIDDFGVRLGRHWGIGQAGKNNGILLIVAPNDRKVRIEVGRGLEPTMTDVLSKLIIEHRLLPAFRRGDFSGGIRAGVTDIKDVLLGDAEAVKERARKMAAPKYSWGSILYFLFWFGIVGWVIYSFVREFRNQLKAKPGQKGQASSSARDDSSWGSNSGGWAGGSGGGWSSSSSDSGSSWSGGGGDFGGGGSSGSW